MKVDVGVRTFADQADSLKALELLKLNCDSITMFSPAKVLVVGLGLLICGLSAAVRAEDIRVDRIDILRAGTYQATITKMVPDKALAAGSREEVDKPALQSSGTTVTAKLGTKFGFEYRIVGEPDDASVTIKRVTVFPPEGLKNPATGETIHRQETAGQNHIGQVAVRGYGFDNAWELVPGVWKFELWYEDRKLAEQSFAVVLPQ